MSIKILMPALSPTMTEGTLARWLKREGDEVSSGDVIAEIETDKATMEVEAVDEGRIGRIVVAEGTEGVPVNQVIAILLEEGEDAAALDAESVDLEPHGAAAPVARNGGGDAKPANGHAQPEASVTPRPQDTEQSLERPGEAAKPVGTEAGGGARAASANGNGAASASGSAAAAQDGGRVLASPLARRMAAQAGIALSSLQGSGPNGRIVKADIEAATARGGATPRPAAAAAAQPAPAPKPAAPPAAQPAAAAPTPAAAPAMQRASGTDARALAQAWGLPFREVKNSSVRKVIARRLTEAKQTIPHFYLTVDCEIDGLLKLRKELNERGKLQISVNDMVIKIAALALRDVPEANAAWTDDATLLFERVDISVAVATDNGLITPIIKNADQKGLATISKEMRDLAGRAREGKLKPEEFQGGTFSISNLGMYGVRDFGAIINPPQACILAVGRGEQRPVVKDGALAIATQMSATLSVDHRVVDGAVGAQYLAAFKRMIEDPLSMLL